MLRVLPSGLGKALGGVRPGLGRLAFGRAAAEAPAILEVTSPDFQDGGMLPVRHTADGEGVSPGLAWRDLPQGTRMLVLLIEDADIPAPRPLVHALATDLPPMDGRMATGELPVTSGRLRPGMGRNSYFRRTYLPMDAIPGHGSHRYCFQLFALDYAPVFRQPPGRSAILRAMAGHVLAKGMIVGLYHRA